MLALQVQDCQDGHCRQTRAKPGGYLQQELVPSRQDAMAQWQSCPASLLSSQPAAAGVSCSQHSEGRQEGAARAHLPMNSQGCPPRPAALPHQRRRQAALPGSLICSAAGPQRPTLASRTSSAGCSITRPSNLLQVRDLPCPCPGLAVLVCSMPAKADISVLVLTASLQGL